MTCLTISRRVCSVLLVLVGASAWGGCASTPSGPAYRPTTEPVREIPASQASAAMATQVASYAAHPGAPQLIHQPFLDALPAERRAQVTYLPHLDHVAQVMAATVAERNQLPAETLQQWLLWRFGLGTHSVGLRADVFTGPGADTHLDQQAAAHAALVKDMKGPVAFGIARAPAAGDRTAQVVVFAGLPVVLGDIPRSVEPGAEVTVTGTLQEEVEDLALLHREGGQVVSVPLEAVDGVFTARFTAPATPGAHYVEIIGRQRAVYSDDDRWQRSLAMFPVYVGPAPDAPDAFIAAPPPNPAGEGAVKARLIELYQKARTDAGLPAFQIHSGIQTRADGLAAHAAKTGKPQAGHAMAEEMAQAGFPTRRMGHLAGVFTSVEEQVWYDLLSPSVQRVLLDRRTTHVGVGVAPAEKGLYAFDFVYAQPVGKLNPEKEREKLFNAFNRRRQKGGKLPFAQDPKLDAALAGYADQVCAGGVAPDAFEVLDPSLQKAAGGRYAKVRYNYIVSNVVLPADVWRFKDIMQSDAHTLSIATCQGTLPKRPGGEYVVLVEATRR